LMGTTTEPRAVTTRTPSVRCSVQDQEDPFEHG
jgi:hypothetical protein